MDKVRQLENALIRRCIRALSKKRLSRRDENLIKSTIRLIQITHSLNYVEIAGGTDVQEII